jgi:putative serine protease PepD
MKGSWEFNDAQPAMGVRDRARLGLAGLVAAGVLACGLGAAVPVSAALADDASQDAAATAAEIDGDITLAERVAEQVVPSVGTVYALVGSGYSQGICQGSGEVLSADGYFLTNYHVIEDAVEVEVILNGIVYPAEIVGSAPSSDVAVLKIDPGDTELTPIQIGDSSAVRTGQWVMTVGTPYGASESVSVGIVSATSRTATVDLGDTEAYYVGLIQTDAMINDGSSGGALVNANGEFIGMNTMSATTSGDWAGMTYAIPSNYVMSLVEQIIEKGSVEYPILGVGVSTLIDAYYSGSYSLADYSSATGVYVASVVEGSGADDAGIQVGDIIYQIDGEDVFEAADVIIGVRGHAVGDTVTLAIERDGERTDVDVVLTSDADVDTSVIETSDEDGDEGFSDGGFGFSFGFGGSEPGGMEGGFGAGSGFGGRGSDAGSGSGFGGGWGSLFGSWGDEADEGTAA